MNLLRSLAPLAVFIPLAAACGASQDVSIGRERLADSEKKADAGGATCGNATCASGQLCCAGPDEDCSPTCMAVTSCPVYGRPCRDRADSGAPTTKLRWEWTCGDPVCTEPKGPPPPCPAEGSPCTKRGETCGDGKNTCGAVLVCEDHDPKAKEGGCPI